MTKAANKVEKRTGESAAGKERKDKKAKEITIIKSIKILLEKSTAASSGLLSKLTKTFSLASLLKSLGGNFNLSDLFMLGNVISPSAIWAKRFMRRAAAKNGQYGSIADNKFINQTITNINQGNLKASNHKLQQNHKQQNDKKSQEAKLFVAANNSAKPAINVNYSADQKNAKNDVKNQDNNQTTTAGRDRFKS